MPEVMLRNNWPGTFRRTVTIRNKSKQLEFQPGVPVELSSEICKALLPDIGVALMPIERDERNKPRVISMDDIDNTGDESAEDTSTHVPE